LGESCEGVFDLTDAGASLNCSGVMRKAIVPHFIGTDESYVGVLSCGLISLGGLEKKGAPWEGEARGCEGENFLD